MLRAWGYGVAALVAATVLGASDSQARRDKIGACTDYANEAVEMQRRNIELGCGITGLRWHEWWDGHYGWCKDWVPLREARHHTLLRREEIARCEDRRGYDRHQSRRSRYYD